MSAMTVSSGGQTDRVARPIHDHGEQVRNVPAEDAGVQRLDLGNAGKLSSHYDSAAVKVG